ncbi:alpha/beta fold hydrolase [Chitinophaga sp. SYP-B3965]|uniref:alpha/beta fold hydrolase n=1 Tax=Chitinophaga sp. SYP-B3965 TaxID=2663120 RepID=UPI001299AF95|nr:alpha/beta hydrolase [Chitinophaga sp. SYP-B3965]MRG44090.1 alpha/beta fold hydrolase [Chitinophaga sp. SYP-B3965]
MKKIIALGILLLVVIAFSVFWYFSPGTTSSIAGANSIAVIEEPVIGNVKQSLIIRGKNVDNPVLLFVHGGPGMSTFPFMKEQFKGLEDLFTICYWEQRGAGKSYSKEIPPESMTLDQLTSDGVEVSRYLKKKFGKEKIYVMGHSWGSLLASFMIHDHPELYHAYIGIGQIADQYLSEQRSYAFVLAEARKRNDQQALDELKKLKLPAPTASGQEWFDYFWIQRKMVLRFGGGRYGVARKNSDLYKPIFICKEYTMADKIYYQTGLTFSLVHLCHYMIIKNPASLLTEQKVPVYIMQGRHDQQTNFDVAKDYFDHLQAPLKKFYAFEHSAHLPHLEEFDTFRKILREDVIGERE